MEEKSLPLTPVPRQIQWPETHGGELQIVDPTLFRPQLPPDWAVVRRPRPRTASTYGRVDKYYIEPGTGRQFRSLVSVHRHLMEGPFYEKSPSMKKKSATRMQIVDHILKCTSAGFRLPEGWIVEEVPRRNVNYAGIVDKYYIEPGTGYRFRSLVSVERYLRATANGMVEPKAIECNERFNETNVIDEGNHLEIVPFRNHSTVSTGSLMTSRNKTGICNQVTDPKLDFAAGPEKVKWVVTGPGGNMFRPFVGGSAVPGSVRQKWSETFVSFIQDRT